MKNSSLIVKINKLAKNIGQEVNLMEVCGTHTQAISRSGTRGILPKNINLITGPGCPVCVTPVSLIEKALQLAMNDSFILCTFGDMMRVPGKDEDLLSAKARGGDVRIVYSPCDALDIAQQNPKKQIVFFAIGFETTAPARPVVAA
jgi:hydrogenase expression/formation protein HypD